METGRTSRAMVMAYGTVRDADGSEHVVSYSSAQQNDQLTAVIEPGRLGVETDRASVAAEPGKSTPVTVRVSRARSLAGPVKVELVVPAHIRGVTADPVALPEGAETAALMLHFAEKAGPFNMPVTVRATANEKGQPVTAETPLEILAGQK
jgi:hypothetical protein